MKKRQKERNRLKKWIEENRRYLPLYLATVIFLFLYVSGMIAQIAKMPLVGQPEKPFSLSPVRCILANFIDSPSGMIILAILIALVSVYCYFRYMEKNSLNAAEDARGGFDVDTTGIYGNNALLDKEDVRNFVEVEPLHRTKGLIIGKYVTDDDPDSVKDVVSISPDGKRYKRDSVTGKVVVKRDKATGEKIYERENLKIFGNKHVVVIGPSGSGKSWCYSRPAIFQSIRQGESVIVTDPKGELYRDTSEYARENGYTVKVYNLAHPAYSDSWDALEEIKKHSEQIETETIRFCKIIMENTDEPNGKQDGGVKAGAENLLTSLALFVLTSPDWPGDRTLGGIIDLLNKTDDEIEALFQLVDEEDTARKLWSGYFHSSENFRGNLRNTLVSRLKVVENSVIKSITGIPDIDLTLPGRSKCAYYIIMEDMTSTFKFVSSLFFTCLFNSLVDVSRQRPSGKLAVPVNVILDEFTAIGRLPDFDKKLATVRSADINISMIFQTLTHLESVYPNGLWKTLLANASTMICLACNDLDTAKYLSDRSGTESVIQESKHIERSPVSLAILPSNVSYSYSTNRRQVMTLGEVVTLAHDKVLVSVVGADLFICNKFPYTDIIDPSILKPVNVNNHVPGWTQQMKEVLNKKKPIQSNPGTYEPKTSQHIQYGGDDDPSKDPNQTNKEMTATPDKTEDMDTPYYEDESSEMKDRENGNDSAGDCRTQSEMSQTDATRGESKTENATPGKSTSTDGKEAVIDNKKKSEKKQTKTPVENTLADLSSQELRQDF